MRQNLLSRRRAVTVWLVVLLAGLGLNVSPQVTHAASTAARGVPKAATASAAPPQATSRPRAGTFIASRHSSPTFVTNGFGFSVTGYAPDAKGNVSPSVKIQGLNTGLDAPSGIAIDVSGKIYVADTRANSVSVFPPGANGDVPPIAKISGPHTGLNMPQGVALDAAGDLFVVNSPFSFGGPPPPASITEYAPGANGDVAPIATISGPHAGLNSPFGIALDPAGNIFVSAINDAVLEFPAGSSGDVAPVAILAGAHTRLSSPEGLAIHAGVLFVANANNTVTEYPLASIRPGTNDLAPSAVIAGPHTGLNNPQGVAVDEAGIIYVVNLASPSNGNGATSARPPKLVVRSFSSARSSDTG